MFLPVIKLAVVLTFIIIGLRKKKPLGLVMFLGAIILGFFFRLPIKLFAQTLLGALIDKTTLELCAIMLLIMLLEKMLKAKGAMEEMVAGVKSSIQSPQLSLALLPALIGLLPSAGGALFSCPLVDQVSEDLELSGEIKSYINFWFRHVWEYFFPLYPAILLTAGILEMPLVQLLPYMLPFTFVAVLVGSIVLHWQAKDRLYSRRREVRSVRWQDVAKIFSGLTPIIVTMLLVFIGKISVFKSLALSVGGTLIFSRFSWRSVAELVRSLDYKILFTIFGVMIFRDIMVATRVADSLPLLMLKLRLPVLFAVGGIPFLLGALTGLSSGFIGVGFPLVMGLLGGTMSMGQIIIAYVCGLAGIMVTPLHLCLVLTIDYFQARFDAVWGLILLSQGAVVAFAFLFYWLLTLI